ncbi:hypothetical protein HMSSN036_24670 [Paenibacillus macerans]|nr:hypothetical protein HMSSN036_24670 [Paenibacillus macerans]
MAKTDWKNSDIVKPDDMNQIGQEINHLHTEFNDRLDMIKTSDITLQPGVQVIQAAKDARFRLGEVRGKTLVSPSPDLLGGKGNFETNDDLAPFFNTPKVRRVETGGVDNSKCLEIELEGTAGSGGLSRAIQVASGKYYVAVAMIRNVTTAQCAIGIQGVQGAFVTSKEYTPAFLRFTKTQVVTGESTRVGLMVQGAAGNTARMDNLRVYEISKAEYDALATMTAEQVAEKYPFGLIGIRGVDGPYAISTFDNLVPPLYEATILSTHAIVNPYELSMGVTDQTAYTVVPFVVQPNTDYTIKVEGDNFSYSIFPVDLTVPNPPVPWITSNARTFNSGDNTELRLLIRSSDRTKQAVFKKPMLVIGADAKPFKPQRKSMLAFQTELQANPVDGSDPDTLFEQNGQYFKLAKWKRLCWMDH